MITNYHDMLAREFKNKVSNLGGNQKHKKKNIKDNILKLPILEVVDKLGLKYDKVGDVYKIWYDGEQSSGWTIYTNSSNRVHDFSHDRPCGNAFELVRKTMGFSDDKEGKASTFQWFRDNRNFNF